MGKKAFFHHISLEGVKVVCWNIKKKKKKIENKKSALCYSIKWNILAQAVEEWQNFNHACYSYLRASGFEGSLFH